MRAISVAIALQGLPTPAADGRALRARRPCSPPARTACWRHRSRFSSANNHLVGELAGMAVVAMLLPELEGAETGGPGR